MGRRLLTLSLARGLVMRRKLLIFGGVVPIALLGSLLQSEPASAAPFHEIASVYNLGISGLYTGLGLTRYDAPPTMSPGTNCNVFEAAPGVFQDSNVIDISGYGGIGNDTTYLEFGTDHQCQGYEWWYGDYVYKNSFVPLWHNAISGSNQHNFWLYQYSSGGNLYWDWQVDSSSFKQLASGWQGDGEESWIESYDGGAIATYQTSGVVYQSTRVGWTPWGQGAYSTAGYYLYTSGPPMCFYVINNTTFNLGENVGSPPPC